MIESELDPKLADYIDSETTHAEIAAEFIISDVDIFYEVGYHVWLEKTASGVCISREYLPFQQKHFYGLSAFGARAYL